MDGEALEDCSIQEVRPRFPVQTMECEVIQDETRSIISTDLMIKV